MNGVDTSALSPVDQAVTSKPKIQWELGYEFAGGWRPYCLVELESDVRRTVARSGPLP